MSSQLIEFLKSKLGKCKNTKHGYEQYAFKCIDVNCPSHNKNKNKLEINIDDPNKPLIHCWVCGLSGRNWFTIFKSTESISELKSILPLSQISDDEGGDILTAAKDIKKILSQSILKNSINDNLTEKTLGNYTQVYNSDIVLQNIALGYLIGKRGLTKRDIKRNNLLISENFLDYIILPSYDINGDMNYFVGRNYRKASKRKPHYNCSIIGSSEIIFNEFRIDFSKPIILVEGIMDYIKLTEHYDNIGFMIGVDNINSMLLGKIKENKTKTVIMFDSDDAGVYGSRRVHEELSLYDISHKTIRLNGAKDVAEMTHDKINDVIQKVVNI